MLKKFIAVCLTLCVIPIASAQDATPSENWIGGFVELNYPDSDKPDPIGYLDDGDGFGFEYGFRFAPNWAARFEFAQMEFDIDTSRLPAGRDADDEGSRFGVDALYFLKDDATYLFTGVKYASYGYNHKMANLGLGRHWQVTDQLKIISEAAVYHDFGQSHRDLGFKVGLAYNFGDNVARAQPADDDNDGVVNGTDQCPNTLAGTPVDAMGCPLDSDNDGVHDGKDQCPDTPAGLTVDERGCNDDHDGDGVTNDIDKCPNTPVGTKVGAKGCNLETDTDQDGVLDDQDQCPDTPLTDKVDDVGCSIFVEQEVRAELNILFANESAVIRNPDDQNIMDFVAFLNRFPNTQATIEGHTSAPGDEDYNQDLSERRAKAVKVLLTDIYGIDGSRLKTVGYGESRLKDTSNTESAHRVNRRIEAVVTATEKTKVKR